MSGKSKATGNASRDYGYQRKRRKRAKNKARKRESIQKKLNLESARISFVTPSRTKKGSSVSF